MAVVVVVEKENAARTLRTPAVLVLVLEDYQAEEGNTPPQQVSEVDNTAIQT